MIGVMIHLPWVCTSACDYYYILICSLLGAFAFYGPGSFSTLYESMISPAAQGHLHFAGEAVSTRHAWVVGALNSAWRAVDAILYKSWPEKLPDFHRKWGVDEEWISSKHLKESFNTN